ncbi:MAG: ABC transporter ATP-binding protein [Treponema sp.]|jgi:lipoprotein-releasing system ATP-binding protein|nr:ABC transporter ATP-binding protein [Treponema sp.]
MNKTSIVENVVTVRDLVKHYDSGNEKLSILKQLCLDVPGGETVAVRGKSGCGKSTLLNIIGGLDRCDSGSVIAAGRDITSLSENALTEYRRRSLGFVFQFHYLLRDFTALENVMIPAFIGGMKKKDALEKARGLLGDLGLEERTGHFPSQLSGGERQRVAVARSMVNDPVLILADEPTGNLDPQSSAAVTELLYSTAEKRRTSLVVVTHDERVAARAGTFYELENGTLRRL